MESKKHASKDLHAQRKKFFLIGLSIALTLVISAFEWTSLKTPVISRRFDPPVINEMTLMNEVRPFNTVAPPEIKKEPVKIDKKIIENPTIIETSNEKEIEETGFTFDPPLVPGTASEISFADKPEETDTIVVFPERNAEPIGGYKTFYETLAKNIKYPKLARQISTEGKVFVQFVVNKLGQPTDFKILRGIGGGCDEEAMRVLANTKWEPGKQRGVPVKVRMVLPIIFKLNN